MSVSAHVCVFVVVLIFMGWTICSNNPNFRWASGVSALLFHFFEIIYAIWDDVMLCVRGAHTWAQPNTVRKIIEFVHSLIFHTNKHTRSLVLAMAGIIIEMMQLVRGCWHFYMVFGVWLHRFEWLRYIDVRFWILHYLLGRARTTWNTRFSRPPQLVLRLMNESRLCIYKSSHNSIIALQLVKTNRNACKQTTRFKCMQFTQNHETSFNYFVGFLLLAARINYIRIESVNNNNNK